MGRSIEPVYIASSGFTVIATWRSRNPMIPESESEWWGYSAEHAWVLVSWREEKNRPGFESPRRVYLIRLRDWKEISIPRIEWSPPRYVSATEWIASLATPTLQDSASRTLHGYQKRFLKRAGPELLLVSQLKQLLHSNFLQANRFFETECADCLSLDEFETIKTTFAQKWVTENTPADKDGKRREPDDEQAAAIAAVNGHVQVVARAGSGKTSTLVNRAVFLMKHCGVAPSEILILAFNKKAIIEVICRLGLKNLPLLPAHRTMKEMARAAVAVYEKAVDEPDDGSPEQTGMV